MVKLNAAIRLSYFLFFNVIDSLVNNHLLNNFFSADLLI